MDKMKANARRKGRERMMEDTIKGGDQCKTETDADGEQGQGRKTEQRCYI